MWSVKVQRIIGNLSRMLLLNVTALKYNISLYSTIILWEINFLIILRFKIPCFV